MEDFHGLSRDEARARATALFQLHLELQAPEDAPRGWEILEELRALEESPARSLAVIERYSAALNNAHVRAGKWGNAPLAAFARDELQRLSRDSESPPIVLERLATSLSDGALRFLKTGDAVEAEKLLDRLRLLASAKAEFPIVRKRLAGALANQAVDESARHDTEASLQTLEELRRLVASSDCPSPEVDSLARAVGGVYLNLAKVKRSGEPASLVDELRSIGHHGAGPTARVYLSKALRTRHYYLSQAGLREQAERLLSELLELDAAHPNEPEIAEQTASAFENAQAKARSDKDAAESNAILIRFREYAGRHLGHEGVRSHFSKSLFNAHFDARFEESQETRTELLRELMSLAAAHPEQADLRDRYARALLNSHLDLRGRAERAIHLDSLRHLSREFPTDEKVELLLAKALYNEVHWAGPNTGQTPERTELVGLASTPIAQPGVIEQYAKLLNFDVGNLQAKSGPAFEEILSQLRRASARLPESGAVATYLSAAITIQCTEASERKDAAEFNRGLDELREIGARFPTTVGVQMQVMLVLGVGFGSAAMRRDWKMSDWYLREARRVWVMCPNDPKMIEAFAALLGMAYRIALLRLGFVSARTISSDLEALSSRVTDNPELSALLAARRKEIHKGVSRWIAYGAGVNPWIQAIVACLLLGFYVWEVTHHRL